MTNTMTEMVHETRQLILTLTAWEGSRGLYICEGTAIAEQEMDELWREVSSMAYEWNETGVCGRLTIAAGLEPEEQPRRSTAEANTSATAVRMAWNLSKRRQRLGLPLAEG